MHKACNWHRNRFKPEEGRNVEAEPCQSTKNIHKPTKRSCHIEYIQSKHHNVRVKSNSSSTALSLLLTWNVAVSRRRNVRSQFNLPHTHALRPYVSQSYMFLTHVVIFVFRHNRRHTKESTISSRDLHSTGKITLEKITPICLRKCLGIGKDQTERPISRIFRFYTIYSDEHRTSFSQNQYQRTNRPAQQRGSIPSSHAPSATALLALSKIICYVTMPFIDRSCS